MERETPIAWLDQFTPVITLSRDGASRPASYQVAGAGARCLAGIIDLVIQGTIFAGIAGLPPANCKTRVSLRPK